MGLGGSLQEALSKLDLSGPLLRIVWSFADSWVDTQMAADVKSVPKLQSRTEG